jgi:hypothetical protein
VPFVRRLLAQRDFAMLLCAAVLALRLIVPNGYMIDRVDGRAAIILCPGSVAMPRMTSPMSGPMNGPMAMIDHAPMDHAPMDHAAMHPGASADHDEHPGKAHDMREMPCAFAGLSTAMLGAVDPILLAVFIAFVMATGLARIAPPPPAASPRLRPPLRRPPRRP